MPTSATRTSEQIQAADDAYKVARDVSPQTRSRWLEAIAAALEDHETELIEIAREETHLTEGRLGGELKRSIFQLRLFIEEIISGETLDAIIDHEDASWGMGPRPDIRRFNIPLGVVGVFGASNFPFAFSVMGGDSASALAAGCAVVHKIHDGHRKLGLRTAEIVIEALQLANAPSGLFSTVMGREAAETLVDHPLTKAVGFTGSKSGGRVLLDRVTRRPEPIPFYGELGSINPVFVTEKAWKLRGEQILDEYGDSFTLGLGQFCTKPGILFAPESDVSDISDMMKLKFENWQPRPMLTDRLRDEYVKVAAEVGATEGVEVLVGGDQIDSTRPTLLRASMDAVRRNPSLLETEMFGPATMIIQYEFGTELAELASMMDGQLTATVQAEEDEDVESLVTVLRETSGRVVWNGWPTGVTVTFAQHHGGPYPATTAANSTSVGTASIRRFLRPVAYQSFPDSQLPPPLRDDNPWGIKRRVNGQLETSEGK